MEHLARVPLFASCPKRHVRRLARMARHEVLGADQALIVEGDLSREAYLLIAGHAVVRRGGRKIAELGPGDFAGELGLLLDRRRTASVRTVTPVEYLVLDRDALKEAIEEYPDLGWRLLQTVASRLADNSRAADAL